MKIHFCIKRASTLTSVAVQIVYSEGGLAPSCPPSGGPWQQPSSSTIWSLMFSLIWVVKVHLLACIYFPSSRKKCFPPSQTMTNPKTKEEGARQANHLKATVSLGHTLNWLQTQSVNFPPKMQYLYCSHVSFSCTDSKFVKLMTPLKKNYI